MKFLFLHPMAFKTSCQSVLDERDDVWTSVHCLKQDLGHQAGLNKIDWYQEKELFRTRWQPKLFPFLWFSFFELSCFIFLNLLTSGWCLWGSAPVLTVLGDRDGVLIDVWTSVHCLKQDLGDQAGFNKIDWYQEKELFRTRWQPKLFPFLWFSFLSFLVLFFLIFSLPVDVCEGLRLF